VLGAASGEPGLGRGCAGVRPAQAQAQGLSEVVITAERRTTNVQKTASSVSVRSGDDMQAEGKYSIGSTDLAELRSREGALSRTALLNLGFAGLSEPASRQSSLEISMTFRPLAHRLGLAVAAMAAFTAAPPTASAGQVGAAQWS